MARPRTVKAHKGLPRGWRWHRGAYRYRVPKGQEQHWDGKTEFRLGSTLPEAHRTYAGRIASVDGAIVSFAQLFDRYLVEVTVGKAQSTQADEVRHISKLREMIGSNPVVLFKPHHAYQLRDSIHRAVVNGSGERYTNRVMEKLKHTLTKAVEWGVIEHHPMNDLKFKMLPIPRNSQIRRAVSFNVICPEEEKHKYTVVEAEREMIGKRRKVEEVLKIDTEGGPDAKVQGVTDLHGVANA